MVGVEAAYLLFEKVLLVQEQNQARLGKPFRVADLLEQLKRLIKPVFGLVLVEVLIEFRQRGDEDNGIHIVKAVDPLATLVPLTTHIEPVGNTRARDQ